MVQDSVTTEKLPTIREQGRKYVANNNANGNELLCQWVAGTEN